MFANNGTEWVTESGKEIDYLVIAGDTPAEIEENYRLLLLSQERLANNNLESARSEADVMKDLDISEADIDAAEDVEIE